MKYLFTSLFMVLFGSLFSQSPWQDKAKAQKLLDSLHIPINKPVPPAGFTLYYNCDSVPYMKKVNGDTIRIYHKGGYQIMDYVSEYETGSLWYYAFHMDEFKVSYISGFNELGKVILQNPTYEELIYRNDSLFTWRYNDDAYKSLALGYGFDMWFASPAEKAKLEKKTKQARKKYKGFWELNLMFSKNMFTDGSTSYKVPKKLNSGDVTVTLKKQWVENGASCYKITISTQLEGGMESSFTYMFTDKMKFLDWESCN